MIGTTTYHTASGIYVVRAANDRGEVLHGKLVKP